MSKSRPPTTKQDLQPRSLSSRGCFPPRHTCQTFRGEHVSKSRGRPLVQLLARHGMPTTGGTAMALTADAWPLQLSAHGMQASALLSTKHRPLYSGELSASRCPFSPNLQKKGPDCSRTATMCQALLPCWMPSELRMHERQHGLGKSLAQESGIWGLDQAYPLHLPPLSTFIY